MIGQHFLFSYLLNYYVRVVTWVVTGGSAGGGGAGEQGRRCVTRAGVGAAARERERERKSFHSFIS